MIDLVLIKRDKLRCVQGMKPVRGMELVFSDHHVVPIKLGL